jgi:hypothetical protein
VTRPTNPFLAVPGDFADLADLDVPPLLFELRFAAGVFEPVLARDFVVPAEVPVDFLAPPAAFRFPVSPLFGVSFFLLAIDAFAVDFFEAPLALLFAVFEAPVADVDPGFEDRLFDDPPVGFVAAFALDAVLEVFPVLFLAPLDVLPCVVFGVAAIY